MAVTEFTQSRRWQYDGQRRESGYGLRKGGGRLCIQRLIFSCESNLRLRGPSACFACLRMTVLRRHLEPQRRRGTSQLQWQSPNLRSHVDGSTTVSGAKAVTACAREAVCRVSGV